ncbi:Sensor histidine kinase regulating citrate/malate metabolism [Pseudarthrobacter enclensis]|nr:sensor histidine kinase [Pseudarthrobacter enclensis]SCB90654.1 Sensor histidine kinase regulating citrate/malate metabolism [Pseudarthrobacter enclensis]
MPIEGTVSVPEQGSGRSRRRWGSLTRQVMLLQLLIVAIVLALVVIASFIQSATSFRIAEQGKLLSVAESLASSPLVRLGVTSTDARGSLAPVAEEIRSFSGSSSVVIADAAGIVLTSPVPEEVGHPLELGGSNVSEGRAWTGVVASKYQTLVVAHAPIFDLDQRRIGIVAVGNEEPTWLESLIRSAPELVTYTLAALVLGVAGSYLISRRIKRQTFGLEPREIAELVQHREAMLHGIKEGVVALDNDSRVALVNDEARRLLELPDEITGKSLSELQLNGDLGGILSGKASGTDLGVSWRGRVLVLNRMPVRSDGRVIGSVTTLRDRTELMNMQQELDVTRNTASALRAQAHEFTNRLHTISALIQLGDNKEVVRYITSLSKTQVKLRQGISSRIQAPALAALLIAKVSLADEQRVELSLTPSSSLGPVDEELEADLVTVVGNLVDNALDVLRPGGGGWITVEVKGEANQVRVTVTDSGGGVSPAVRSKMFERGFTTKKEASEEHGIGLALVRLVCTRRGGAVEVTNAEPGGAVFTALLPYT